MKLADLIRVLEDQRDMFGEDANVYIGMQQSYPFECRLAGVAVRCWFEEPDINEDGSEDYGEFNLGYGGEKKSGTDIFLLEGSQLAYGSRDMWDHAQR